MRDLAVNTGGMNIITVASSFWRKKGKDILEYITYSFVRIHV